MEQGAEGTILILVGQKKNKRPPIYQSLFKPIHFHNHVPEINDIGQHATGYDAALCARYDKITVRLLGSAVPGSPWDKSGKWCRFSASPLIPLFWTTAAEDDPDHGQNSLPLGRLADTIRIFLSPTIASDVVHNGSSARIVPRKRQDQEAFYR